MFGHGLVVISILFSLIAPINAATAAHQRRHGDLTSLSSKLQGALVGSNVTQQTMSEDRATTIDGGLVMIGLFEYYPFISLNFKLLIILSVNLV